LGEREKGPGPAKREISKKSNEKKEKNKKSRPQHKETKYQTLRGENPKRDTYDNRSVPRRI